MTTGLKIILIGNLGFIDPLNRVHLLNLERDLLLQDLILLTLYGLQVPVVNKGIKDGIEGGQDVNGFVDGNGVLDPLGPGAFVGRQLTDDCRHLASVEVEFGLDQGPLF